MPETFTTISELPDYGSVQGTDRIAVDRLGAAVSAGAFVVGQAYQIVTAGSTDFVVVGAASNTVGAYFVATGAGSGTGTAAPINTGDVAASAIAALATAATVGLANANNTSDLNKPISTATQAALDAKATAAGTLAQFAATTSAQLAGVMSDETGTGPLVFGTSPSLVAPALGTPSSVNLANGAGLPLTSGVTGILPVASGGTGTASPGLVAGSHVTISGSWPNQTISASGGGGGGGGSGTVTSVGLVAPTGFSVTGSPVTTSGNITLAFAAGYSLPLDTSQANWNTAFTERLRWDGSSTGLDATTGRTSLGLGSLATQSGTFSGTSSGTNTGDNAVNTLYSGLVSNANHTGDATGSTVLTLATVNANVGTFGSATAAGVVTVNAKGLVTGASSATITPAVGSITGLGTGVATALAANIGSAGAPVVLGGAGGTPSAISLVNGSGLPLTTGVTGLLPVASGGTGTATPGLVQGANVTISGSWPNQTISASVTGGGGGDALVSQPLSQFAATTSAQLRAVISDETGTGLLYFQGGSLGTPSSVTLSNGTSLPLSTGISGFGTGIAAALAINTGTAGAPVLFNGAGGTPSSATLTNATGLPLATGVTGTLPVANGGTGTATPGLVAGSNVTISGSWPNQTINATGGGSFDPASPGAIGGTTAAAGSFTALSASTSLLLPNTAGAAAGHLYRVTDQLRYRDSGNVEQVVLYGGGNLANLGSASTARANLGLGTAATAAAADFLPTTFTIVNVSYGATINIDFTADTGKLLVIGTLTGNLAFTFSNIVQGKMVTVDILCDATQRNLTFPANAKFLGSKPANIAASKAAAISFTVTRSPSSATDDSAVRAAYGVQT